MEDGEVLATAVGKDLLATDGAVLGLIVPVLLEVAGDAVLRLDIFAGFEGGRLLELANAGKPAVCGCWRLALH